MKIVLGCMEMGRRLDVADSRTVLERFLKFNREIDTACMYADGESEKILGDYRDEILQVNGLVATKVNPNDDGFLPENIISRFQASLSRLKIPSVDLLYLHFPCHKHPLEPVLDAIAKLHENGLFKRFGLSNYPSWEVYKIFKYCENNGYVKPVVYQGMYNCLTRDVERELFPCIRDLGLSFYAYNPLAGGLLTGRYKYDDKESFNERIQCRFHGVGTEQTYKMYCNRFWHKEYFDAIDEMCNFLPPGRSILQVSLDWLINHSQLSSEHGDGLIIGASTIDQYDSNMSVITQTKPLPEGYVKIINSSYSKISGCVASYFR